jgi:hypothetical protein
VRERIRATRALTERPFAANLVLEWDQHERLRMCADERVAVVSTFWGDPGPYVDTIHACGALHLHTGYEEGAKRLAKQTIEQFEGCDHVAVNAAGCGDVKRTRSAHATVATAATGLRLCGMVEEPPRPGMWGSWRAGRRRRSRCPRARP